MFRKILYPTDFSEVSNKVISAIKQLKNAGTKDVILLHVIDSRNLDAIVHWAPADYQETQKVIADKAAKMASEREAELRKAGFSVKIIIIEGIPAQEILKAEKSTRASAIIIGSHGRSNIREMLLGSVSEQVIKKARKPVIVIKR